ncbi:MAG TPA: hypothetical protein VK079_04585 [Bacillota bacterium]|nr:hypothetical protein [Bacillota bacterium]
MNIHQVLRGHLVRPERQQPSFRTLQPNQVIQAKIVKLFPNQQAMIQIGQEQKIAQLDTALAVGEKYYFQVLSHDDFIHLKVLGEPLETEITTNIQSLLQQLGLSSHRQLREFVQYLMQNQVPFDRNTLIQSLPLLALSDDQQTAFQMIEKMIRHNLPLTKNVFLAQQAITQESFTKVFEQTLTNVLQNGLKTVPQGEQLLRHIQDFQQPLTEQQFSRHFLQIIHENEPLRTLFQNLNIITDNGSFNDQSLLTLINQRESMINVEPPILQKTVQQLVTRQGEITSRVHEFLVTWEQELLRVVESERPIPARHIPLINDQLRAIFQPFLASENIQAMPNMGQQPEQITPLLNMLYTLNDDQTYHVFEQLTSRQFSPKVEFLQQIQHTLTHLGLNYEQMIQDGRINDQSLTLKQALLQLIQQQFPVDQERTQQLLHFINGLQIQSVEETSHFIYGNFVLPGEKLQLNSDLYMQFQSKKTKDGSIDPNHCRILFFLHLESLDQTVVDMNVQDRIISITVFNNHEVLKMFGKPLENHLKERLSEIDYQLSSITYKRLAEHDEHLATKRTPSFTQKDYSGVDFRI